MEENGWWLSDYALFMAVKGRFDGAPWTEWAQDIRLRWGYAMDYYRRELYFDIEFQQYLQFTFYKQWQALKDYANRQGVRIIGDIPIYVAMTARMPGRTPSFSSWIRTMCRWRWQDARRTDFPLWVSSGEIPCTAGTITADRI